MPNPIAIVRRPAPSLAGHCELTFIERAAMSPGILERQHRSYCDALAAAGADLLVLDAIDALPDSVFVEDTTVMLDELAILTRPGSASRLPEPDAIAADVARHRRRCARILAPGALEGGDVLRIGRTLYVGLTTRSNRAGIDQLDALVRPHGYRVIPVATPGSLHLKTACTALDDRTLLMNPAWVDASAFDGFEIVTVADGEPFAANVLPVGASLVANAAYPRTLARVRAHAQDSGREVIAVDISEFGKAEAGLTCMSLVFNRAGFDGAGFDGAGFDETGFDRTGAGTIGAGRQG